MRDIAPEYDYIYAEICDFADKSGVEIVQNCQDTQGTAQNYSSTRPKRIREISSKLKDFFIQKFFLERTLPPAKNPKSSFKEDFCNTVYKPTLSKVTEEFDARLGVHKELFASLSCLDPKSSNFIDKDTVSSLTYNYPTLFNSQE